MRAPGIEMGVLNGGTGNLWLKPLSGKAGFAHVFGVTGSKHVEYVINDGNSMETGIGVVDLTTLVLTRSVVISTWDGSTWDASSPAPLNISVNAVLVTSNTGWNQVPALTAGRIGTITGGDDAGTYPMNAYLLNQTMVVTAARIYYCAFYWGMGGEVDQAAHRITTGTAGNAKLALYDVGTNGAPNYLIRDFGEISTASGATVKLSAPTNFASVFLPPGWYYAAFLYSAAPTVRVCTCAPGTPVGLNSGADRNIVYRDVTYAGFTYPAQETNSLTMMSSGTGVPLLALRVRA